MGHVGHRGKEFNFFLQDDWRVRRNLTVTYGVRGEMNLPPTTVGGESVWVPDKPIDGSNGPVTFVPADSWYSRKNLNAVAPRLGIAWSPHKSRMVIRAGYGIAFDPLSTFPAAAAANNVPGLAYTCTAS